MAEKDILDEYGDWEWLTEMKAMFGTRRMVELFGYLLVVGVTTSPKWEPARIVDRMVSMGISRAAAYKFLADIKRFKNRLEEKRGYTIPMSEILDQFSPENLTEVRKQVSAIADKIEV